LRFSESFRRMTFFQARVRRQADRRQRPDYTRRSTRVNAASLDGAPCCPLLPLTGKSITSWTGQIWPPFCAI